GIRDFHVTGVQTFALPISLDFTYGSSLTHDLFDGFDRRRRAQTAQIREESAALAIADVRTSLEADLNALYAGYQNSLQLIALERSEERRVGRWLRHMRPRD